MSPAASTSTHTQIHARIYTNTPCRNVHTIYYQPNEENVINLSLTMTNHQGYHLFIWQQKCLCVHKHTYIYIYIHCTMSAKRECETNVTRLYVKQPPNSSNVKSNCFPGCICTLVTHTNSSPLQHASKRKVTGWFRDDRLITILNIWCLNFQEFSSFFYHLTKRACQ